MGKLYTKDSIESLNPLQFTRLKPGVYCGDTTYSTQLLIEIISNSIDEYRAGHGNKIEIVVKDNIISVRDYGQGFLVNEIRKEDKKTVLEAAFSVLNTSGKYNSDGTYEGTSLGAFGIGSKLATFLSHWLEVTTFRDGKSEFIRFEEGIFKNRKVTKSSEPSGTLVIWEPSEEFFINKQIEVNKIKDLLHTISCLCPGLVISFTYENDKQEVYESNNGIDDLVDQETKGKEIISNRFRSSFSADNKNKMDFTLTYVDKYNSTIIPYVNTGLTEKGPHITLIKTFITREFNKFFREKGWIKEKEENLDGSDIQEGMYIVFNITAPNIEYNAQVKTTITRIDMKPFMPTLGDDLATWLSINEKEIKIIADKAINARKAREAAKKARDAVRTIENKKEKIVKIDSKLADCSSKNRTECEIYITEGDSASGNLKMARDNKTQAVLPIRGKILNTQKATLAQVQKNQEIMSMIQAFGLKVDPKTMKLTYDKYDLRYGKIIIMSDADVDGAHIKNLFYTFIWNFCPQLIIDGHVYAGVPPLYKITEGNGKNYVYLKNDAELEAYRASHKSKSYAVNRLKGLGEMSGEETEETLTDKNNRIIKQITVDDIKAADRLFEELMGGAAAPRKEFIKEHSKDAGQYNAE